MVQRGRDLYHAKPEIGWEEKEDFQDISRYLFLRDFGKFIENAILTLNKKYWLVNGRNVRGKSSIGNVVFAYGKRLSKIMFIFNFP